MICQTLFGTLSETLFDCHFGGTRKGDISQKTMDRGVPLKRTLTGPDKGSGSGFKLGNPFSGFGKRGDGLSASEPLLTRKFGHSRRASMNNLSAASAQGPSLAQKPQLESPSPVPGGGGPIAGSPPVSLPPPAQGMTFTREDYEIGPCIGQGSSALVYVGTHKPSGSAVSLKVIDLDMFERNQIDELRVRFSTS